MLQVAPCKTGTFYSVLGLSLAQLDLVFKQRVLSKVPLFQCYFHLLFTGTLMRTLRQGTQKFSKQVRM